MKILQISPYFFPYQGGQERYIYHLSKELVKMGHSITLITSNFPRSNEFEILDGIHIHRVNCNFRILRNPITFDMLRFLKIAKNYDIINVHNEHSFAALAAIYFRQRLRVPIVVTCHGLLRFGEKVLDAFENFYFRTVGKLILKKAEAIITLSNSDKNYIINNIGVEGDKINVIPNAIDINYISSLSIARNMKIRHKSSNRKIVLFVGPVIRRKGIEHLINAIPAVVSEVPEAFFLIVGDGDFLESAKKLSKDLKVDKFIQFTGRISDAQLFKAYETANLFVLPSISEGLPTAILEAFFFELPVIVTDIPSIREHFENCALFVPQKNNIELSNAIVRLLNDESLAANLAINGKQILSAYSWSRVAKEYERVFKKVLT
jgi:glycosyltransferase involved in cell wall biosynthesis